MDEKRGGWNRGKKLSEDFGNRVRKGLLNYYKNNPVSKETRKKLSESHLGKLPSIATRVKLSQRAKERFDKGFRITRPVGWKMSEEQKLKLSQYWKGRKRPKNCGTKHWNWKGGIKKNNSKGLRIRFKIFLRDEFKCQYCGRGKDDTILELDHKFPKSKGGNTSFENLITACRDCNRGKNDLLIKN